jgi:hypothetical protein
VAVNETLQAVGSLSGDSDSSVGSAAYVLQGSAPTFSPAAGTYSSNQTVTISQSQSLAMCYTTDGSTPTSNGSGSCSHGTLYSTTVTVSVNETLKAIGMASGWTDSSVGSAAYVLKGSAPTFSPAAGSYGTAQTVTISQAQSLAKCYTLNGSTPASTGTGSCATGSTSYSSPITVSATETVKAIGYANGWTDSSVGSAAYTITTTPNPPSGLTVALTSGNGVLNWTASSTGGVTYDIYRGTTPPVCANGTSPMATGVSAVTYTDTSVIPGVNYYYEVSAVLSGNASGCNGPAQLVVPPTYPVWSGL